MSVPFTSLFIDGQHRPASTAASYEVRNPYTHAIVGHAAAASSQDCKDAIEAAQRAFVTWEHTPVSAKRDVFLKAADLLGTEKYREKVKTAMQEETAAIDSFVAFNFVVTTNNLRTTAGLATQLKGETFPSGVSGGQVVAQRRAMGVIYAIAPWNAPLILTVRAVATPILCGNTVVLKCSEVSPRTQAITVELLTEAGLPNGVLNFISTSREDAPARTAEIIAHPAVRKVNFTGSDRVGKIIAMEAAKYLKPCVLELGGKAPVVVLEDADIERAARAITSSALVHSGQICMSTERVIVQRSVAPALTSALTALFNKLKAGGPGEALSALFTEASAENVLEMIREVRDAGAKVLSGDLKREGSVVQPHLVADVKPGMRLWDRESFGPVTALMEVDTVDEAVAMANASEYSLVAGLWTQNVNTALDVAARIRSGQVNVNGQTVHVEALRGIGGIGGASGYGHFDIENFTDLRTVIIHPAKSPSYALVG
ncbi:hypothetical protein AcV5_008162 [Taiwanofungus camphoratus]|nr:hypothetical protein AcV5_008162 [Antrodia cinnamomea]